MCVGEHTALPARHSSLSSCYSSTCTSFTLFIYFFSSPKERRREMSARERVRAKEREGDGDLIFRVGPIFRTSFVNLDDFEGGYLIACSGFRFRIYFAYTRGRLGAGRP